MEFLLKTLFNLDYSKKTLCVPDIFASGEGKINTELA